MNKRAGGLFIKLNFFVNEHPFQKTELVVSVYVERALLVLK